MQTGPSASAMVVPPDGLRHTSAALRPVSVTIGGTTIRAAAETNGVVTEFPLLAEPPPGQTKDGSVPAPSA
jgi:hypothetical protein